MKIIRIIIVAIAIFLLTWQIGYINTKTKIYKTQIAQIEIETDKPSSFSLYEQKSNNYLWKSVGSSVSLEPETAQFILMQLTNSYQSNVESAKINIVAIVVGTILLLYTTKIIGKD